MLAGWQGRGVCRPPTSSISVSPASIFQKVREPDEFSCGHFPAIKHEPVRVQAKHHVEPLYHERVVDPVNPKIEAVAGVCHSMAVIGTPFPQVELQQFGCRVTEECAGFPGA